MNNQGGQKSGDHVLNIYHDSRHLVLPKGHTSQTGKSAVSSLHKSTTTEPALKLRSQEPMVEASVPRPAAVPRSIKQPMALPPVKLPTPNGAIMNSRGSASNPTITFTSDNRGAGSLNHNVQPVTTDLPQNSQYADTHMATSYTERLNRAMTPEIKQAAHRIAVRQAEASAIAEAQRREAARAAMASNQAQRPRGDSPEASREWLPSPSPGNGRWPRCSSARPAPRLVRPPRARPAP